MARAYIVVARNDVPDNLLQTLDIWPNTSQRNAAVDPAGQTHYNSFFLLDGVNANVVLAGAGPITVTGDTYGLSAYLVDNVLADFGAANRALTAGEAVAVAARIEDRVALGLSLRGADIDAILVAEAGANTSLTANGSSGSVEEVLRILAGERYLVPNGSEVADAVPNFTGGNGYFVARPNVELPESVRSGGLPVRGKNSFVGKTIPTSTPVQAGQQDTNFQDVLAVVDTGRLQQSAINGALAKMADPTFTFENGAFTYGGGATPAFDIGGNNIGTNFQGRAVAVYAADGSLIV